MPKLAPNDPGKRLLKQIGRIESAATALLKLASAHPELANSEEALALRALLSDPFLQEVKAPLSATVARPAPGVLIHRMRGERWRN